MIVPEVAVPTPVTVNTTVPLFTAPDGLVTVALSVTVCGDTLNGALAAPVVVLAAEIELGIVTAAGQRSIAGVKPP